MLKSTKHPKYYVVPVVERTLDIMELLKGACEPMTVAAISDQVGIALSTAYRILRTLVNRGYVSREHNGYYGYGYVLAKSGLNDRDSSRVCTSRHESSRCLTAEISPKPGSRRLLSEFPIRAQIAGTAKR